MIAPLFNCRKRKPAFTDRILFRIKDESDVEQQLIQSNYRAHPDYLQSDHKPVSSLFTIKIRGKGDDVTDGGEERIQEPISVEFDPIDFWKINEDTNWIRFRFTDGKGTSNRAIASRIDRSEHWIGIFPANFTALDQWINYAFADDLGEPTNQMRQGSGVHGSSDDHGSIPWIPGSYFTICFPCLLVPSSHYRLIYFDGLSVLGICSPFQAWI